MAPRLPPTLVEEDPVDGLIATYEKPAYCFFHARQRFGEVSRRRTWHFIKNVIAKDWWGSFARVGGQCGGMSLKGQSARLRRQFRAGIHCNFWGIPRGKTSCWILLLICGLHPEADKAGTERLERPSAIYIGRFF